MILRGKKCLIGEVIKDCDSQKKKIKTTKKTQVVNVIDESDTLLKALLESFEGEIICADDGIDLIRKAFNDNYDLIIIDVNIPLINGFQCTRILKNDNILRLIPIILIGNPENQLDEYWSITTGADHYLLRPIYKPEIEDTISKLLVKKALKSSLFASVGIKLNLKDSEIISLNNNIVERNLLYLKIINEISSIEVSNISLTETITSIMMIIESLYDFSLGMVLTFNDNGEFVCYQKEEVKREHIYNNMSLMIKHVQEKYDIYLQSENIEQRFLYADEIIKPSGTVHDIYLHTSDAEDKYCLLCFDNIGFDNLSDVDQFTMVSILDAASGIVEKKLFFDASKKQSMIDTVKDKSSYSFFMTCLSKEMEKSLRNGNQLIIFTIYVSNFNELTQSLNPQKMDSLINGINRYILDSISKNSLVARVDTASFAFFIPNVKREQLQSIQERISNAIMIKIKREFNSHSKPRIELGINQFNPDIDKTPEILLKNSMPKGVYIKDKVKQSEDYLPKDVDNIISSMKD
jgi:PleD family two-component response regulator